VALSYELVTRGHEGREHTRPYTSEDTLSPGSIVSLGGRYWLVVAVEQSRVEAVPARYRLTLRHPDGHEETGVFRRFRADAPRPGHELTTIEDGAPAGWTVVEERLAQDEAGRPFLESIAERDYTESETLADHQLEHAQEQDGAEDAAATTLARAEAAGLQIELVGLDPGQAPDWDGARRFVDALIIEEIGDYLLVECGVDTHRDPPERWLDIVKERLREDLESFRADVEGAHDEIEAWDFRGGRVFAAVGRYDDDANALSGYGWMCRLVDADALQAAGFQRVRKAVFMP
jgi:hypothetical protein